MKTDVAADPDYALWVLLHQATDAIARTRENELRKFGITMPELEFMWKKSQDMLNRKIEPGVVLTIEPRAVIGEEHRGLHMGPTIVTTGGYPRILTRYGREVIRI